MADLSVFNKFKTLADYQNAEEDRGLSQLSAALQLRKAMEVDVDKLGERAFMKAAQGIELTPQERAAAQVLDAKSGGIQFNPVTGSLMQKPRISDKIGLDGMPTGGGMAMPTGAPSAGVVGTTADQIAPLFQGTMPAGGDTGTLPPVPPYDGTTPVPQPTSIVDKRMNDLLAQAANNPKLQQSIKDSFAKTRLETDIKAMSEFEKNYGSQRDAMQGRIKVIDDMLAKPGLDANLGLGSLIPNRPGSEASDAAPYIEQIKGGQFLEAYNTLKGGGQITEVEGKKAEAAIARMQTNQSPESFRAAALEFRDVIQGALDRQNRKAQEYGIAQPQAAAPSGNWSATPSGQKYRVVQ
jgi:hypothetical protein